MKFLTSAFFILLLTSCSLSNDNNSQYVRTEWHLKNVTGGIDGVSNDFNLNTVIWTFNEVLGTLNIENNNTNAELEDGFDTGNYTYSLIDNGNNSFIIINQTEFGSLTLSNNQMTINQNEKSTGTGADGYIYKFQLVEINEDGTQIGTTGYDYTLRVVKMINYYFKFSVSFFSLLEIKHYLV